MNNQRPSLILKPDEHGNMAGHITTKPVPPEPRENSFLIEHMSQTFVDQEAFKKFTKYWQDEITHFKQTAVEVENYTVPDICVLILDAYGKEEMNIQSDTFYELPDGYEVEYEIRSAGKKPCSLPCGPSDYYPEGKCGRNGCCIRVAIIKPKQQQQQQLEQQQKGEDEWMGPANHYLHEGAQDYTFQEFFKFLVANYEPPKRKQQ